MTSGEALDYEFSHVHIYATEPITTVRWLTEGLGGEVVAERPLGSAVNTYVLIGGQHVTVRGRREAESFGEPVSGSSGIDHFGISVSDLPAALEALRKRGIVPEALFDDGSSQGPVAAFLRGPDDIRVELTSHQTFQQQVVAGQLGGATS